MKLLKSKKIIYYFLLLLVVVDIGYSFVQHYGKTIDGDVAWNLIPAKDVKPVLERPFGIKAIVDNETYINPNRFFSHWSFREYLLNTPLFLQNFTSPVTSVYLASAIAKSITQTLLILLLSLLISGTRKNLRFDFILSVFLITALFQTNNSFVHNIGLIDDSITYLFFYGLPAAILVLYLTPFVNKFYHGKEIKNQVLINILWIPLAFVVCLSGPLNPGAILIFSLIVMSVKLIPNFIQAKELSFIKRIKKSILLISKGYWFYLTPIVILSLYSLFLGKYNSITIDTQIPLSEMYAKIPRGIYETFFKGLGYNMLFLVLIINSIFIRLKFKNKEGKKILRIITWITVFSVIYIFLLPLGGYREYRPFIIRNDTIIPITIGFIFAFGISALFLIKQSSMVQKRWHLPLLFCVVFIYTKNDNEQFDHNQYEIDALNKIANSTEKIVEIKGDRTIMNWHLYSNPEESRLNSKLLMHWNIIEEEKLFYNVE
jgi:hypothetical protein